MPEVYSCTKFGLQVHLISLSMWSPFIWGQWKIMRKEFLIIRKQLLHLLLWRMKITVPVWLDRAQLVLHKVNPTLAEEIHYVFTQHSPRIFSPPGSSVPGILQTRIQEWEATPFSRGSPQHSDQTLFPCIAADSLLPIPSRKPIRWYTKVLKEWFE